MPERPRNVGASVRARLLNLARERGQAMELLLTRYALECLLHRLSLSPHRDRFVLKGALLLTTWIADPHRATRDVDLLGFGDSAPEVILATFRDICAIGVNDGVAFDADGMRVDLIREELEYGGVRLRTIATLAGARIPIVVDIGFGDAVEPGIEEIELPVLLDRPTPRLRAYPRESVIAEKFQAMIALGRANSRMKDFYDVWMLLNAYEFETAKLEQPIRATFARRKTALPQEVPDGLTDAFADDTVKQRQWEAFARELANAPPSLRVVIDDLRSRLMAVVAGARQ